MPTARLAVSRRRLIAAAPALGLAAAAPGAFAALAAEPSDAVPAPPALGSLWPTQEAALAREMVGASHGRVERVKELLALHPSLAKATWDWGFGDWESALGAASHVGNREIAELLLAHGARPDIFCAAMLGQLETVKAFVAMQPGCQRIPGPHGITLLSHAKAGGDAAKAVVAYLESIEGADVQPATQPLGDSEQQAVVGVYRFGSGENDTVEIAIGKFGPTFTRKGNAALRINHAGERAFFPVGAPNVRIRLAPATGAPVELTVHDPEVVLTARRIAV